jgi:hypothetical protein
MERHTKEMKYDYALFPRMETGYLITPSPSANLKPFKKVYDRFCSALYMASMISAKAGKCGIDDSTINCAYVRATLSEFTSIEEFISQLYPEINCKQYKLHMSNNPAFHFLKLLRNYNIHLSESTLSEKTISVALKSEPEKEYDKKVFYIDNLDIQEILKLTGARHYTNEEIKLFIECFDLEQHVFGVIDLLMTIVVHYSEYVSICLKKAVNQNKRSQCDSN